jgi:hypothetical protein
MAPSQELEEAIADAAASDHGELEEGIDFRRPAKCLYGSCRRESSTLRGFLLVSNSKSNVVHKVTRSD